jgi:hypothetical protein
MDAKARDLALLAVLSLFCAMATWAGDRDILGSAFFALGLVAIWGAARTGADWQSLKISGHSWAEKLLRRHETRVWRVAKRLLQPPYKITREQFEQLMQEEG